MRSRFAITLSVASLFAAACTASDSPVASLAAPNEPASRAVSWGPETPNFNLEVILRGDGFGHVEFRQRNDASRIVDLGVWVRDLAPNHQYQLQRAVDQTLDGVCTSTSWLTLGKGLVAQTIETDDKGTGREALFRDLSAFQAGTTFDIHFQVIDASTHVVVLTSDCYQFTVSQ